MSRSVVAGSNATHATTAGDAQWVKKENGPFQFTFNGSLKVAFQGAHVTADAGRILVRELDEHLGLEHLIAEHLSDSRQGLTTQFSLSDLLRQSVYSRLAGHEDLHDAVRLSTDPTFRLIGSPKRWDRSAALTSTLHWFETELLTREENLVGLMALNRDLLAQSDSLDHTDRVVLDMDSSESPVHGAQEGSAYNGHADCLIAKLRLPRQAVVRFHNKRGTAEQWIKEGKQAA